MPALILACNHQAELGSDAVPGFMLDGVPDGSALFNEGHAGAEAQQLQGVEKDGAPFDTEGGAGAEAVQLEDVEKGFLGMWAHEYQVRHGQYADRGDRTALSAAPDPELLSGVDKGRAESAGDTGLGVAGQQGGGPIDAPLR
jgi:hypothetical protein